MSLRGTLQREPRLTFAGLRVGASRLVLVTDARSFAAYSPLDHPHVSLNDDVEAGEQWLELRNAPSTQVCGFRFASKRPWHWASKDRFTAPA
ncbi:MAG: hypothetical protein ACR2NZ_23545 [Rubripirellula sp.]